MPVRTHSDLLWLSPNPSLAFDMTVIIIEPTARSVDVYHSYLKLLEASDAADGLDATWKNSAPGLCQRLFVLGNKCRSAKDREFIRNMLPKAQILGYVGELQMIRDLDQTPGASLDVSQLDEETKATLAHIHEELLRVSQSVPKSHHLRKLHALHTNCEDCVCIHCCQSLIAYLDCKQYPAFGSMDVIDRDFSM